MKSKKRILIILSTVLVVLLIGVGAYGFNIYKAAKETANEIYKPLKNQKDESHPASATPATSYVETNQADPISILLLGVDERAHDKGRSDTMIVLTLNPQDETMQMVSIPRDTRALLGNTGTIDKINAAYFYGGSDLAVQTVEQMFNIKLDYYVRINMEGLKELVNSLGGITVNNKFAWHDEGYYKKGYLYEEGNIRLDGAQALGFVRMRHLDPNGDFGRNNRQRDVIKAIVDQAANFSSLSKYQSILYAIQNNVATNLTFDDMKKIIQNYRLAKNHVVTYEVKGQGKIINKLWYYVVDDTEKQKVSEIINNELKSTEAGNESATGK